MTEIEWTGSECPESADGSCWIDDDTGEHVSAYTGERTPAHPYHMKEREETTTEQTEE